MIIKDNKTMMINATIIITILSQLEILRQFFRPMMYVMWIALIVVGIVYNKGKVKMTSSTRSFILIYIMFALFCSVATLISKSNYYDGSYFSAMIIPLIVLICAGLFSEALEYDDIIAMCKTFVICALIYGIYINITYFPSYGSWLTSKRYVFPSKNSAAQIWSVAIFISFFMPRLTRCRRAWPWYVISIYLLFLCGLSQARTSILGIAICTLIFIILSSKHKIRWSIVTCVVLAVAFTRPAVQRFFDQALLISRYSGQDANAFSSGRLNGYINAINNFWQSPLIGNGSYYIDCSYVMILAEVGLIGFILIETIWVSRMVVNFRWRCCDSQWKRLISAITLFYIVESLLEGLPPFGPGVSSFMFWLLCGVTVDNHCFQNLIEDDSQAESR